MSVVKLGREVSLPPSVSAHGCRPAHCSRACLRTAADLPTVHTYTGVRTCRPCVSMRAKVGNPAEISAWAFYYCLPICQLLSSPPGPPAS